MDITQVSNTTHIIISLSTLNELNNEKTRLTRLLDEKNVLIDDLRHKLELSTNDSLTKNAEIEILRAENIELKLKLNLLEKEVDILKEEKIKNDNLNKIGESVSLFKEQLKQFIIKTTNIGKTTDIFEILKDTENDYELNNHEIENKHKVINYYNTFYRCKVGIKRLSSDLYNIKNERNIQFHISTQMDEKTKQLVLDYCNKHEKWKDENNEPFVNMMFDIGNKQFPF